MTFNGTSASFWLKSDIDVDTPRYPAIKVEFSLYFVGMDNLDYFYVDFWDGTVWQEIQSFNKNDYGGNNNRNDIELLIEEASYVFPINMNIRFRGGANGTADLTYVDNVRISAMEPLTTLYEEWMAEYGLAETNLLADTDLDGMNNLVEYALGGNPTNQDAAAVLPVSEISGDWLEYVYQRRTDAEMRGLTYRVEANTNLISGIWSTNDIWEAGAAPLDAGFESVTNRMNVLPQATSFIRLLIQHD